MTATLHVLCGKMASGKTTVGRQIAERERAIFISEDVWLERLFPGDVFTFADYLDRSRRLRAALAPHVRELLGAGLSVVFDFAGNVPQERAWARSLCDPAVAELVVHYLNASDELCKARLRRRNSELPEGAQATTDDEFDAITTYFVPPAASEGLAIREYDAAAPGSCPRG